MTLSSTLYMRFYVMRWSPTDFLFVSVKVEGTSIERTQTFKYLGVTLQQSMSWADHVDAISMKINQRTGLIWRIRNLLPLQARVSLY